VHEILARAGDGEQGATVEKRHAMQVTVDGITYKVSGAFDHLQFEKGCLTDYKVTSVYARGGKDEWEAQLNLLALILAANNRTVVRLQNVLIFRDWRPKEALREDYPQAQVAALPIRLWPKERTVEFLHQCIRDHVAATPRPCTDEERWHQPDKWAHMKKGRKTAIKLYEAKPPVDLAGPDYWEHRQARSAAARATAPSPRTARNGRPSARPKPSKSSCRPRSSSRKYVELAADEGTTPDAYVQSAKKAPTTATTGISSAPVATSRPECQVANAVGSRRKPRITRRENA
jgi:hypothetical protein